MGLPTEMLWATLRIVAEPGAAAFAAVLSGRYRPQPGEKVGMRASGPSRVDPGVEPCRRPQLVVAEELPNQFVRPGIRVEDEFRRDVPELMAAQLNADMPEHALLDR